MYCQISLQCTHLLLIVFLPYIVHTLPLGNTTSPSSDWISPRCPMPCSGIVFQDVRYVCGDPRLGPLFLPKFFNFPLTTETATYSRFGDLCPLQFLQKWARQPDGSYTFPENSGFQLDDNKNPIAGTVKLPVGKKLDRFGSEMGRFLSPLGAPFIERALPPDSLNTIVQDYKYDYHVYQVIKEFEVMEGPVAAWFEQPGGGSQYMTLTNTIHVIDLVNGGFLIRLAREEYDDADDFADNYTPGPP